MGVHLLFIKTENTSIFVISVHPFTSASFGTGTGNRY